MKKIKIRYSYNIYNNKYIPISVIKIIYKI